MKKRLDFIKALFADFDEDCTEYIKRNEKKNEVVKYSNKYWGILQDRNTGKTALKRKIVMLRQELFNLYKEIEKE